MELKTVNTLIQPMLAQEVAQPFDNEDWLFEIKWDGYRAITHLDKGKVKLYSRNNILLNNHFPSLIRELEKTTISAIVDGEIVLMNENGKPDFQKLQNYKHNTNCQLYLYLFDIISYKGESTCDLPLIKRKQLLYRIFPWSEHIKYNDHIEAHGINFFEAINRMSMEGVMAKKIDGLYYPGRRSTMWLKIKKNTTITAYIAGYTQPAGSRKYFGSLVLGFKKEGKFVYAGHVGTGFDNSLLKSIYMLLYPLITDKLPFIDKIKNKMPVTWVIPELECEIKFSELTSFGIIRHPVFLRIKSPL